jgi:hypothetical protein
MAQRTGLAVAFMVASGGLLAGLATMSHYRLEVRKLELKTIAVHEEA